MVKYSSLRGTQDLFDKLSLTKASSIKYFICCNKKELNVFGKLFNLDDGTNKNGNIEESIRYSSYDNYDFLSLKITRNIVDSFDEINSFICNNFILFVIPDESTNDNNSNINSIITSIKKRIDKCFFKKQNKDMLNRILYFTLDAVIDNYSRVLERIEDNGEFIKKQIISIDKKQ
ncbi:hypothetical protein FACS189496_3170 [Bacilli bacterium]|nr:hypothetical protein FACS189496_3170 [Bacilli bacterium]